MKRTFDIAIGLENEEYISFRTQIVQTHLCFEFLNYVLAFWRNKMLLKYFDKETPVCIVTFVKPNDYLTFCWGF